MNVTERGGRLELCANPIVLWLPASLFALVGGAFLVLAAQEAGRGHSPYAVAGAFAAGVIGLIAACFVAGQAERITVAIDKLRRTVTLTGRQPWRRREAVWTFDEIADFELEPDTDDDGDPIWYPVIRLRTGERVPMSTIGYPGTTCAQVAVEAARRALGSA